MATDIDKAISDLEVRRQEISKTIGNLFGADNARAHAQYRSVSRRLGALLLQRDRIERPHIYRRDPAGRRALEQDGGADV